MKIIIIIDETNFYHPKFFFQVYKKLIKKNFNIKVGIVTKIKPSNSIENYLKKNIKKLFLKEIFLLGIKKLFFTINDKIFKKFNIFFTVRSVCEKFNIDFFLIEYDINQPIYLKKIRSFKPDIILSSCSVIFSEKILQIPKYGCVNRHTSLLPSYGGLYPVFHSIADNQKYSGVTIHKMTKKIDDGQILAQAKIENLENNLSKIYKKGFEISSDLILKSLRNLIKKKYVKKIYKKKYFSFPDNERWKKFRKNNGKFI